MINLDVVSYKNGLVSNYIWKNHINYLNHNLELVDHVVAYNQKLNRRMFRKRFRNCFGKMEFDFDVGAHQSLKLE